MKRKRFFHFFWRSVAQRKGRNAIAALSVMLAVAVVTGMTGVTAGIRDKLGAELKSYGANVMVSPGRAGSIPAEALERIKTLNGVDEAAGQFFGTAALSGQTVELIGLEFGSVRGKGWRLFGRWPEAPGQTLAGITLKNALKIEEGDGIQVIAEGREHQMTVTGFIEKGGAEDRALIMDIHDAWSVTGRTGTLGAILVRAKPERIDEAARQIREVLSGASVKTVRQVAFAEESLLGKIQLLMALVTAIVVFASSISVASTMGANVLERREEIGLMKALGAMRRDIGLFFFVESLLIGLAGGAAGFILGLFSAEAVSKGAFGTLISPPLYLPAVSFLTGVILTLGASYLPVREAMRADPAVILRGE